MTGRTSEIWGYPIRLEVGDLSVPVPLKLVNSIEIESDGAYTVRALEVLAVDLPELKRRVDFANEQGFGVGR